jgi:predicted dehydrogenase
MIVREPASASRPLRIAVVGAGRISKYHFVAWQSAPDVAVVAVCDIDAARAREAAEEYAVPASYDSVATLLEREKVDALDIASPPDSHEEILGLAAARGVDCLCQKPMARDFDEATRIVENVTPRIRLMVNENRRHLPYFQRAQQWIAEGSVGKIQQASMTAYRSLFLPDPNGKYSGTPALVHGVRLYLGEAMIHQIDALRSLLGPLRVIAARTLHTDPVLKGDTLCTLFMKTEGGAPVVISGNSAAVGYPKSFNDRFEILGSRASIVWEDNVLRLLGPEPREEAFDMEGQYAEMYQSCFTTAALAFREALRSGGPFPTDAKDNLETLRIVEDAYRLAGEHSDS